MNHNPHHKMRIQETESPTVEEMQELYAELMAVQEAISEVGDDDIEMQQLKEALRSVVGRLRLNAYRMGRFPQEVLDL